jgi:hypothetical protein
MTASADRLPQHRPDRHTLHQTRFSPVNFCCEPELRAWLPSGSWRRHCTASPTAPANTTAGASGLTSSG